MNDKTKYGGCAMLFAIACGAFVDAGMYGVAWGCGICAFMAAVAWAEA